MSSHARSCHPPLKLTLALLLLLPPLRHLEHILPSSPCPSPSFAASPVRGAQLPTRVRTPRISLSRHHQSRQGVQGWRALSGDDGMLAVEWWPTFTCSLLFPLELLLRSTLSSCLHFRFAFITMWHHALEVLDAGSGGHPHYIRPYNTLRTWSARPPDARRETLRKIYLTSLDDIRVDQYCMNQPSSCQGL